MMMSSIAVPKGDHHETYIDKEDLIYQDSITPKAFIFSVRAPWRNYWEMFVLILACYNAVMTPFEFSFAFVEAKTD